MYFEMYEKMDKKELEIMSERYTITGVQLGMILAFAELGQCAKIKEIAEQIMENQFIGEVK